MIRCYAREDDIYSLVHLGKKKWVWFREQSGCACDCCVDLQSYCGGTCTSMKSGNLCYFDWEFDLVYQHINVRY